MGGKRRTSSSQTLGGMYYTVLARVELKVFYMVWFIYAVCLSVRLSGMYHTIIN